MKLKEVSFRRTESIDGNAIGIQAAQPLPDRLAQGATIKRDRLTVEESAAIETPPGRHIHLLLQPGKVTVERDEIVEETAPAAGTWQAQGVRATQ